MNKEQLKSALESLLFISGEPLSLARLEKILKAGKIEIREALDEMLIGFNRSDSGLALIFNEDSVQLTTRAENSEIVKPLIQEELQSNISKAALEVLAIIAYRFPVSRADIDEIRGVDSSYVLRNLLVRGLVERGPHPERANAFIYQPSFLMLKTLGISKVEELPEWQKIHEEKLTGSEENIEIAGENQNQ